MKLDDTFREKNGLGPSNPEPKKVSKRPAQKRLTFDGVDTEEMAIKPEKVVAKSNNKTPNVKDDSEEAGFIDKVLAEKDEPKKKKTKPVKPPKKPKASKSKKKALFTKPKVEQKSKEKSKEKLTKPIIEKKPTPKKEINEVKVKKNKIKIQLSKKSTNKIVLSVGKTLIFLFVLGFCIFNFLEVQRLNNLINTQINQITQNSVEHQKLIKKISEIHLLPDSRYEIYTIKDKAKLIDDPVFDQADNGDKVVIYPDSSLTIVYRENENKIVSESNNFSLTEKK